MKDAQCYLCYRWMEVPAFVYKVTCFRCELRMIEERAKQWHGVPAPALQWELWGKAL